MTTRETTAILETQDLLTKGINGEMEEYTGIIVPWGFTEKLYFLNGRVWHEIILLEEQRLMYATQLDHGHTEVVQELEEARNFLL